MNTEQINTLIETQLEAWPDARRNFDRLREVRRKPLTLGDFEAYAQLNPARIVSTGAKIDAASIAARPCFLCRTNRPAEQITVEWMPGWELLVNPFPILPVHFTIASTRHTPQNAIPSEMAEMAEKAPSLAFFYNGARAGASAPDHLHVQAVLKSELPLLRLAEQRHTSDRSGILLSDDLGVDVPFRFYSAVITPDYAGMKNLLAMTHICGEDADSGKSDPDLVNAFFWMGNEGLLRAVVVPRRRHRPLCYGKSAIDYTISPGALDMAGIMVTVRQEDFDRLDADKMREIYGDCAIS